MPNTLIYNIDGGNIYGTVNTVDATVTIIDTIDNLTDDSSHLIKTFVTVENDTNTGGGVYEHNLFVTKRGGTVVIDTEQTVIAADDAGSDLNASSVTFVVNGGNIDIKVEGAGGVNFKWDSMYLISLKTTN